jgi:hypothetical protein
MRTAAVAQAHVEALGGNAPRSGRFAQSTSAIRQPFSVWSEPGSVADACRARSQAFHGLRAMSTMMRGDDASIRWHGLVGDQEVEGIDLFSVAPRGISTIDVFLRPASPLTLSSPR